MSGEENKRSTRVAQLIQHELAQMLVNEIKDPRVGFATITEVRMTDDLKVARVFVSVYGDDKQRDNTLEGLKAASGFLRREISHRIELRHTPTLTFHADASLERAQRIDTLLNAASHGETEIPSSERMQALPVDLLRGEKPARRPTKKPGGGNKRRRR